MKLRIGGHMIDLDVEEKWSSTLWEVKEDMSKAMRRGVGKSMEDEIRKHVSAKYPNSEHWDLNKINASPTEPATVDVDIPGAVRNYWDVDIYPVSAPSLVYPTDEGKDTYGLKEWTDIYSLLPSGGWFTLGTRYSGHDLIAAIMGGNLVALFHLRDHVFQAQDDTLLPTDETLCSAICAELMK